MMSPSVLLLPVDSIPGVARAPAAGEVDEGVKEVGRGVIDVPAVGTDGKGNEDTTEGPPSLLVCPASATSNCDTPVVAGLVFPIGLSEDDDVVKVPKVGDVRGVEDCEDITAEFVAASSARTPPPHASLSARPDLGERDLGQLPRGGSRVSLLQSTHPPRAD